MARGGWWFGALAALALIGGGGWWAWTVVNRSDAPAEGRQAPPVTVAAATARADQWARDLRSVGSLRAVQAVDVTAERAGQITEVAFGSGAQVAEGAVLVRLDADDERAELRALEAELELARRQHQRFERLERENAAAQAELDRVRAERDGLRARIAARRARIAEMTIRAPFAGRLGIERLSVGQFIEPGTPLVHLTDPSPIRVDATVPQQAAGRVAVGQTVEVQVDAWPGRVFRGRVVALDPVVDPATRTLAVEGELANADGALRPGMFVSVRLVTDRQQEVVTVPQSAISRTPHGNFVFVINPDDTVSQRTVTLGPRRGDRVAVADGLTVGTEVVMAGTHKLADGDRVRLTGNDDAP